jgi:hypothetical protein
LRAWPIAVAAVLATLLAPAAASAHLRSGLVATGYRARVTREPGGGLTAAVYPADRAVSVRVPAGHRLTVLAPSGRPLLVATGATVWHDPRLRGLPAGVSRGHWTIPLRLDGAPTRVEGELWRVPAPAPWPWLALGLPVLALGLLRPGALGSLAAAATVATALVFAAAASESMGRRLEAFDELVFAAVGVALLRGGTPARRAAAAGGLGLLALTVGGLRFAALTHGVVLAAGPDDLGRGLVALTLWAGAAAAVAAALNDVAAAADAPAPSAPRP